MLNHVFTTPILRQATTLTPEQLGEIAAYLLGLRSQSPGIDRSNRGGWHSEGNLFAPEFRQFPAMRGAITAALFSYIGEVFSFSGPIQLALTGWTVVNRPGDFNTPHNHAANLLSGALYLAVPGDMRGGEIQFQDPRLNLNAHDTEPMLRAGLRPPWLATSISVPPCAGEILVFPSWLIHWVDPYQSDVPDALRVVVSFNATIG